MKRAILIGLVGALLATGGAAADEVPPSRPAGAGPTRVEVAILVLDLVAIDDPKQEFTADVFTRLRWQDERLVLSGDERTGGERVLATSTIWTPELVSLNRRNVSSMLPAVVRVDDDGQVTYEQRLYGTFAARLDLRKFPADAQELPLRAISYRHSPDELELVIDPVSGLMPNPSVAGWAIEAAVPRLEPLVIAGAARQFAGLVFNLRAEREVAHYLLTVALPLLLIAAMAWSVFWIPPQYFPSQIAVSTASVFTLIAFRFSIKLSLPTISYLTTADKFLLAITLLVFAALGHAVTTGRLAKTGREELANAADRWARWIYLAVLVGIALYTLV